MYWKVDPKATQPGQPSSSNQASTGTTDEKQTPRNENDKSTSSDLRDYQEEAITACTNALEDGLTRFAVSLPTASGKTTPFINLISRVKSNGSASQVLILVPYKTLVDQTKATIKRVLGKSHDIGMEHGAVSCEGDEDM